MELIPSHCFGIGKIIHKRTRDTDNFFQYNAPYLSINLSNTINIHPFISLNRFNFFSIFYKQHGFRNKKKSLYDFAKNVDFKMYLATQFFFEAKSLIDWEKHLVKIGNKLPIHAGIPGPASIKTLVNYARSCGIGNSLRFITKQAFNLTKLATLSTPDKLIYDLAEHSEINKDSKLEKIHFYAFGGMKKTSEWLNQFNNSDFSYNNKQKFELN